MEDSSISEQKDLITWLQIGNTDYPKQQLDRPKGMGKTVRTLSNGAVERRDSHSTLSFSKLLEILRKRKKIKKKTEKMNNHP